MKVKQAKFITTVANADSILTTDKNEIAFVGRSNAGKSSLINALTNQSKLAKTSSTPGKTRHINYFLLNEEFYLVDLPGYGYHKASKSDEKRWGNLIETYLLNSRNLSCVFVLMDIRHTPSELDKQMLTFLHYYNVPYVIIATKADKLSRAKLNNYATKLANNLGLTLQDIIITSANKKQGMQQILDRAEQFLNQNS